jgi:hypothetical protein
VGGKTKKKQEVKPGKQRSIDVRMRKVVQRKDRDREAEGKESGKVGAGTVD